MRANLSEPAKLALVDVGTYRQGAVIPSTTPSEVVEELVEAGMIGRNGLGLSRCGSIQRERIMATFLEAAF